MHDLGCLLRRGVITRDEAIGTLRLIRTTFSVLFTDPANIRLKLPLTMAIIDGLVVRVGQDRFILPSTSVQMALRPKRAPRARCRSRC
mgnify:CR=1 FL=1